jgi:hypothetical protein
VDKYRKRSAATEDSKQSEPQNPNAFPFKGTVELYGTWCRGAEPPEPLAFRYFVEVVFEEDARDIVWSGADPQKAWEAVTEYALEGYRIVDLRGEYPGD